MKLIESNGYQIALIEVPYDTAKPIVFHGDLVDNWADEEMLLLKKLPPGSWSILGPGLSTLCSEGDAAKVVACEERSVLVDFNAGGGGRMKCNVYKDYEHGEYAFDDALTSLESLIRSYSMKPENVVIVYKKL